MSELVVLAGATPGTVFPLAADRTEIGRNPSAALVVEAAGWRQCVITRVEGRYRLDDQRSALGTFVNGIRITSHWLEDGDQITMADTTLLFRDTTGEEQDVRTTLLRSCTLQFLFRALGTARAQVHQSALESQIVQIISGWVPCESGHVITAHDPAELSALIREKTSADAAVILAACADVTTQVSGRLVALPLYVAGAVRGAIALRLREIPNEERLDLLSAICTLASTALETAIEVQELRLENAVLEERLGLDESGIVGDSPAIRKLLNMIERIGAQETTVLILGESGTGKELVARALHRRSRRAGRPFIAINCAALTESLLESELFGHEKGAFTGAVAQKKGKLELAERGTVFLDEIGELAPALQAKLLRVLQEREFERVGGTRTMKLDIRLIAATNRDLAVEVKRGAFREDLYHRLNVISLRTPPLRERREDIPLIASHFLRLAAAKCGRRVTSISDEAVRILQAYDWPGNVRELENAIERAAVMGETEQVLPEDLPESLLELSATEPASPDFQNRLSHAKRESIVEAWRQAGGDYKAAAQSLGLHPNSLLRLIRNLGLRDQLRD